MRRSVICYFHYVSHVLNLGQIPALMQADGWDVTCVCAFSSDAYPLPQVDGIRYRFDDSLQWLTGQTADLYLSPLVGQTVGFPKKALRVHFLVSLTSLEGVYDDSMFDHVDVIACAGHNHMDEFRALGKQRGWKGKVLLPLGYPKLDGQRRLLQSISTVLNPESTVLNPEPVTVVFAPTHAYYVNNQFSVLGKYGEAIVESLIHDGFKVIFRPHIESWRDQDKSVVDRIVARHRGNQLFVLDRSGNYFSTYAESHLMLTDISGTGFTYAFTFGKPALFFAPDAKSEVGKKGIQFECRENVGLVVRNLDNLSDKINLSIRHMPFLREQIVRFRDWMIFNLGGSEKYFVSAAGDLLSGQHQNDWIKI